MRNLISAEWVKLLPHKGTWMLVWIYPALFLLVLTIAIFAEGKNPDAMTATGWVNDTTMIWYTPVITLGRYFIAAWFALVFAGEYGWNTWKLVVPHASRWKLIASKYAVALALLYTAWIATALLSIGMQYIRTSVVGAPVPAGVTFGALMNGHLHLMMLGIAPLLVATTYATLVAVLTRSTLAAFIISLVLITLDELLGKIVILLSSLGIEWPAVPYRILPGYHLQNLGTWLDAGKGFDLRLASGNVIAYSQTASLLVLAAWIGGMAAATFIVFRRQDIN